MKHSRDLIVTCPMRGDFYELDLRVDMVAADMCGAVTGNLWHRRLARLGNKNLHALVKRDMVTGMSEELGKLDFCDVCVLGKQCRDLKQSGKMIGLTMMNGSNVVNYIKKLPIKQTIEEKC